MATCTNQVYRGMFNLPDNIDFNRLITTSPANHSADMTFKLYTTKPRMHLIKSCSGKWTVLLFSTGRFRVMGPNTGDSLDSIILQILLLLPTGSLLCEYPSLQTETFTFTLGRLINLYLVNQKKQPCPWIIYEAELFPAMKVLYWSPINVNVFHTGKVVVMGATSRNLVNDIYLFLQQQLF